MIWWLFLLPLSFRLVHSLEFPLILFLFSQEVFSIRISVIQLWVSMIRKAQTFSCNYIITDRLMDCFSLKLVSCLSQNSTLYWILSWYKRKLLLTYTVVSYSKQQLAAAWVGTIRSGAMLPAVSSRCEGGYTEPARCANRWSVGFKSEAILDTFPTSVERF